MKVGDLVRLSAYGKDRKRAEWINPEDVGLVIGVIEYHGGKWPPDYKVDWVRSDWNKRSWGYERCNTRKDLKYAKC